MKDPVTSDSEVVDGHSVVSGNLSLLLVSLYSSTLWPASNMWREAEKPPGVPQPKHCLVGANCKHRVLMSALPCRSLKSPSDLLLPQVNHIDCTPVTQGSSEIENITTLL